MNLQSILTQALQSDGLRALAERHGLSVEDAAAAAQRIAPALGAAAKRRIASPDGAAGLAGMLRANDAADAADDPVGRADALESQGGSFLDQLFGGARAEAETAVAERAAEKTSDGVGGSHVAKLMPMVAGMLLGGLQKHESSDSGMNAIVGALLGGGSAEQAGEQAASASTGFGGILSSAMGALTSKDGGGAGAFPDIGVLSGLFDADDDDGGADALIGQLLDRR